MQARHGMFGELGGWFGKYLSSSRLKSWSLHCFSPGRFYATAVMKLVVGHIIKNYDCQLAHPRASRWFTWRSTMLPKQRTMVLFTPVS